MNNFELLYCIIVILCGTVIEALWDLHSQARARIDEREFLEVMEDYRKGVWSKGA